MAWVHFGVPGTLKGQGLGCGGISFCCLAYSSCCLWGLVARAAGLFSSVFGGANSI